MVGRFEHRPAEVGHSGRDLGRVVDGDIGNPSWRRGPGVVTGGGIHHPRDVASVALEDGVGPEWTGIDFSALPAEELAVELTGGQLVVSQQFIPEKRAELRHDGLFVGRLATRTSPVGQ